MRKILKRLAGGVVAFSPLLVICYCIGGWQDVLTALVILGFITFSIGAVFTGLYLIVSA